MATTTPLCDACGLPPRPNQKQLLTCTRCHQAHYHDAHCQRRHYPTHKAACRRVAAAATATAAAEKQNAAGDAVPARTPWVSCRAVEGKGRALVAARPLAIGCRPLPARADDGLCAPLAHPVLLAALRRVRCAFCFRLLPSTSGCGTPPLHLHCSSRCQRLDTNWSAERRAARKLPSPPSPTALSCARLLRIFQASPAAFEDFNRLCCNVELLSQEEKEAYVSILTQCHVFLIAMADTDAATAAHDLLHPTPAPAYRFMSRLSMNGFTVSDAEQLPLGHGIYCGASMMNHACRPTAVPSFWLREARVPMLQVTVCRPVKTGEEVTISYCDTSTPLCIRRDGLWKSYKFVCDCPLCNDACRDDDVVGLRCAKEGGCTGRVRSIAASHDNECISGSSASAEGCVAKERSRYRCDSCGNTRFDAALNIQAEAMKNMTAFEVMLNNSSDDRRFEKKAGAEARQIHEALKKYCDVRSSYYVAWSADLCVHWCANALTAYANEHEQLGLCHQALVVLNESRAAAKSCFAHPGNLAWHVKRGLEAKLRLFVNPADMEALGMLGDVRTELLRYYPASDATVCSLEESLAAYSFS